MSQIQIINVNDGQQVSQELIREFDIESLCTEGKVNFVGFINKHDRMLLSCPKHFVYKDDSDIRLIVQCIMKSLRNSDKGSNELIDCNIPYRPYLQILTYYNTNGLFYKKMSTYTKGYGGNIDWNRTIRKSQKVVNDGNLFLLPFEIRKNIRNENFISECMKFVLNDGYDQFGKYAGIGMKIEFAGTDINFRNTEAVIKRLKEEEGKYFRDSEIQLIRSLISYFRWEGSLTDKSFFVTQSFDLSWENMVQAYLNRNFLAYDMSSQCIVFSRDCRKRVFRKIKANVESPANHQKNHGFHVEYDHLSAEKEDNTVIVFDSKYYEKISEVNYKQIAYHYFLMSGSDGVKYDAAQIINGLILPTEGSYYSKVHVDRRDVDGVYIQEHYLNLREVMQRYAAR